MYFAYQHLKKSSCPGNEDIEEFDNDITRVHYSVHRTLDYPPTIATKHVLVRGSSTLLVFEARIESNNDQHCNLGQA